MELGGAADASRIVREKPAGLMTSPTQTFVTRAVDPGLQLDRAARVSYFRAARAKFGMTGA